jgi:hypothetical protein
VSLGQAAHERVVPGDVKLGAAELARLGGLDLPAEDLRAQLHAVADAQHRHAEVEDRGSHLGALGS